MSPPQHTGEKKKRRKKERKGSREFRRRVWHVHRRHAVRLTFKHFLRDGERSSVQLPVHSWVYLVIITLFTAICLHTPPLATTDPGFCSSSLCVSMSPPVLTRRPPAKSEASSTAAAAAVKEEEEKKDCLPSFFPVIHYGKKKEKNGHL